MSNQARAAAHKERMRAAGFEQVNVWLPAAAAADLRQAAEVIRQFPHLTIGRLVDPVTGQVVGIKSGPTGGKDGE
jgi:hypothetical protein